jgi:predicted regulator of Ras-like GTPase activity (Roadblock/LC7/MglB family)
MSSLKLSKILQDVITQGNYLAALVTDQEGFAIASASKDKFNAEMQSAVISLFQRATAQASEQLGESITSEFTLYFENGTILVSRPFQVNQLHLNLSFLLSDRNQTYRRLMTQTMRAVQNSFEL